MSLRNTDVRTPGIAAIAKKFNLPIAKVVRLVNIGAKTEFEHNKNLAKAKQVARDHISERPDYYQKLKKMEKSPISMKEMDMSGMPSSYKNIEDRRGDTVNKSKVDPSGYTPTSQRQSYNIDAVSTPASQPGLHNQTAIDSGKYELARDKYLPNKDIHNLVRNVREETSVGSVRGLGFITGDPAVDPVTQYIDTNAMAYEDQNGNVLKLIKKQNAIKSLGFTPYDPTQDHGDVKTRILGRKIMKEARLNELSGGDSRDTEGGVSGLPKSAYRKNEIEEGKRLEKVKKAAGKVASGSLVAANLFTLGQVAGDAAEGRGSPKRSVIAAATAKPGIPGLVASGAHYGLKVKDFMRRRNVNELYKPTPERLGRYISRSAGQRAKALEGPKADIKTWERKDHFIKSAFKKLTKPKLDEYANSPTNDYTKPYFTKSLVRSTRTSHEHIATPDRIEEPGRGGKVSPNGK